MAVALTAPGPRPPTAGLETREVVDPETLELWRHAVDCGFGWPSYAATDRAENLAYFLRPRAPPARSPPTSA